MVKMLREDIRRHGLMDAAVLECVEQQLPPDLSGKRGSFLTVLQNGIYIEIENVEEVTFSQDDIDSSNPHAKSKAYFTCCNWQFDTPDAMRSLCDSYNQAVARDCCDPLILSVIFIFDFLCIHPFNDGNGRMIRLFTLMLLYQHGYIVGKYISLEKLIEKTSGLITKHCKKAAPDGSRDNAIAFRFYDTCWVLF